MSNDSADRKAADRKVSTGGDENADRNRGGSVERKTESRQGRARHEDDGRPRAVFAGPRAAHGCNGRDKATGKAKDMSKKRTGSGEAFACSPNNEPQPDLSAAVPFTFSEWNGDIDGA